MMVCYMRQRKSSKSIQNEERYKGRVMNIWTILGIGQTDDKGAIKQAYREQLKSVNPEEDADGFMELRNAYEEAIASVTGRRRCRRIWMTKLRKAYSRRGRSLPIN